MLFRGLEEYITSTIIIRTSQTIFDYLVTWWSSSTAAERESSREQSSVKYTHFSVDLLLQPMVNWKIS